MEYFFKRLEAYIKVRPTAAMRDIIVKIMVEVISILGIVTKEIRQGRTSKPFPVDISPNVDLPAEKYLQEAVWNEGRRGRTATIRQIDARGGSDGSSRGLDDHSRD